MNCKHLLLLLLFPLGVLAQQSELDSNNNRTPIFPGCELAENRYECYIQRFGAMILDPLNAYHKIHPLPLDAINIELIVRTEADGTSVIKKLQTSDAIVENIAKSALNSIPKVYPIIKPEGDFAVSTEGFWIKLRKNDTGAFEQIIVSKTEEWRAKPSQMPFIITDAVFTGCEGLKAGIATCFVQKCGEWLLTKLSNEALSEIKGTMPVLKISIDEGGGVFRFEIFKASPGLTKELIAAIEKFPQIQPSTVDGNPYKATYMVPLNFK